VSKGRPLRIRALAAALLVASCTSMHNGDMQRSEGPLADWPSYGGNAGGTRFSPLTQINRGNVARLEVAWEYRTGDVSDGLADVPWTAFQMTPIVVDGTMYASTPFNRVVALDPETGREKWRFDPRIDLRAPHPEGLINRGVSLWADAKRSAGEPCRQRVFLGTIDARLFAIDAATGRPCEDFGAGGQVDLKRDVTGIRRSGDYELKSAPAIVDDLVVVGSSIIDNDRVDAPSGVVRAFDARSGRLRWSWDAIPRHLAPTGGGNAWVAMSVDAERGLVFVPTGSASPDYYGGRRPGDNKWANSVVALSAKSGEMVWGFQLVHHDLWDYDTASQPILADLRRDGASVPVVIQGNKAGSVFVLQRATGVPVFAVEERPVPASDVPGEAASPTQPFPVAPPPLVPQRLRADDAWALTPEDRAACRDRIAKLRSEGIFTPPSVGGTVVLPGNLGGMNWSGGAFDPARQLLVTNVTNIAAEVQLVPRERYAAAEKSAAQGHVPAEISPQHGTPYGLSRKVLASPSGLPCTPPPWGSLVAVDIAKGAIRWSVPLGTTADLRSDIIPPILGTPNLGGPIVTTTGLVFIASATDNYLRAFDTDTGTELWKGQLPAGGQAAPMTYRVRPGGKQYVVIAAGGHAKLGTRLGDSLVAFALP
jgi:quinoprotein glucose dehydrogenase